MNVIMSKWMALLVIAIHLSLGWSFSNLPHLSQLSRIAVGANTKLSAWDSYGGLNGDYSSYGYGRGGRRGGGRGGDYYDNYDGPGFSSSNPHSMAEGSSRLFRGASAGSRYSSYGNDSSMYNNPMRPYGSRYYNDRDNYPAYSYYYNPEDYEYGERYGRGGHGGYSMNNRRRNRWYGLSSDNRYDNFSYRGGRFGGYGYGGGGYGYGTGYGVRRRNMFDQSGSGYYGTYFNDRFNNYYDSPYFSYYYSPESYNYGGYGNSRYGGGGYANSRYGGGGYGNSRYGGGGYGNSRYGGGGYANSRYGGGGYASSRYGGGGYANSRYGGGGYANSRYGYGNEGYERSSGRANLYNRGYRGYMSSSPEDDIRVERTRRRFANLQDGDSKLFGNRARDAVSFDKPRQSNLEYYASPYSIDSRYYDDYENDYDDDYYGDSDGGSSRYGGRRGGYGGYDSYDGRKPWSLTDEERRQYEGSGSSTGYSSSASGRYSRNSGYSGMATSTLDTFNKYTPLDEGGSRLFDSSDE